MPKLNIKYRVKYRVDYIEPEFREIDLDIFVETTNQIPTTEEVLYELFMQRKKLKDVAHLVKIEGIAPFESKVE